MSIGRIDIGIIAYTRGIPIVIIDKKRASLKILRVPGIIFLNMSLILLNIFISILSYTSAGK